MDMNSITPGQLADEDLPAAGFEGEIREFIRKDVAPWRRRQEPASEPQGESISMLVQRVAGASMHEIDNVIDELRTMRDFLRTEGERVQREVAGYATLSQTAAASVKSIADSMVQWRAAVSDPQHQHQRE
jgi:hypothetical protein